jgi:hypothetical protein
MGDRVVDCARLESVCAERHRGFESPPIRSICSMACCRSFLEIALLRICFLLHYGVAWFVFPGNTCETMKMRLLLGLVACAILCSCAANTPGSETTVDTDTQNRRTVYGENPEQPKLSVPVGESSFPLNHSF